MRQCLVRKFINKIKERNLFCLSPKTQYELQQEKYNIGVHSYMAPDVMVGDSKTIIGKFCSIAPGAFIGPGQHPTTFLSTHPFQYLISPEIFGDVGLQKADLKDFTPFSPCVIENDVWIGCNAVVMDGVKIQNGAIIGSNATVTKDVPPYAVVVGNGKIIKYRFAQEIIDQLLLLKWWDLSDEQISTLPFGDIEECIKKLKVIRGLD